MPATLVGTDLDLAADVRGNLATEVTFGLVVGFDPVAKRDEVVVVQLVDAEVTADLVASRVSSARVRPMP